jgi:hypothetical protein
MDARIRLAFALIGALYIGLVALSIVPPPPPSAAPSAVAPEPPVTCAPSELFPNIVMCSDGRFFRFDRDALRDLLERPRVRLLAGR